MAENVLSIPSDALVIPVGPSGSGKSTFAAKHFLPSEIVSSDDFRERISDDATNPKVSGDAFEMFHLLIEKRLTLGRLTVADATNLKPEARKKLRDIASRHGRATVVLLFDRPLDTMKMNNHARTRVVPEHVIDRQWADHNTAIYALGGEGHHAIYIIQKSAKDYVVSREGANVATVPSGLDVIGDIHGCPTELFSLLYKLGYWINASHEPGYHYSIWHPEGRQVVLVGDVTDRGPDSVSALRIAQSLVASGHDWMMGNHDNKLLRALKGNNVRRGHGLQDTIDQIARFSTPTEVQGFIETLSKLPYYKVFKVPGQPDLVVSHAGIPQPMVGRTDGAMKSHALYGEVLGFDGGLPIRGTKWHETWPIGVDKPWTVHGHTVTDDPYAAKDTTVVNVDTGLVFGGKLTAFQWPSGKLVQVEALKTYSDKRTPMVEESNAVASTPK